MRSDGTLHVCAIGFTWDATARLVRVITSERSQKVRNVEREGARRWHRSTAPGGCRSRAAHAFAHDPAAVADAVARHAARYREPRPNPARVAIEIEVVRVLGRAG